MITVTGILKSLHISKHKTILKEHTSGLKNSKMKFSQQLKVIKCSGARHYIHEWVKTENGDFVDWQGLLISEYKIFLC